MIKWLKYLCGALGVVTFFSLLACSPTQASAASLQSSALAMPAGQASPLLPHSAHVESCGHHGGMEVTQNTNSNDNTFKANGQIISVTWDYTTGVPMAIPNLPDHTYVKLSVPANTGLILKECDSMKVTGISGPMNLSSTHGMDLSKVRLFYSSHLHVDNGTLNFDGSMDLNSNSTFDSPNGVNVKLPLSDSYHIDATASEQYGNVNANPGSFCQTPRKSNVCQGDNNPGGLIAHLTVSAQWNINLTLV